jgi:hypothetical protein
MEHYNKLDGLPSIYILTLDRSKERRELLNEDLKNYKIKNYTYYYGVYGSDFNKINSYLSNNSYTNGFSSQEIAASISHLNMIKQWYENSNDDYALFFEDDICFYTVKLWRNTWKDFIDKINHDFDILQLSCLNKISDVLIPREDYCYSAAAYMLKREHAKKILEKYFIGNQVVLDSRIENPCADHIIYSQGLVYSISMFVSRCNDSNIHEDHIKYHVDWKNDALKFLESIDRDGI